MSLVWVSFSGSECKRKSQTAGDTTEGRGETSGREDPCTQDQRKDGPNQQWWVANLLHYSRSSSREESHCLLNENFKKSLFVYDPVRSYWPLNYNSVNTWGNINLFLDRDIVWLFFSMWNWKLVKQEVCWLRHLISLLFTDTTSAHIHTCTLTDIDIYGHSYTNLSDANLYTS